MSGSFGSSSASPSGFDLGTLRTSWFPKQTVHNGLSSGLPASSATFGFFNKFAHVWPFSSFSWAGHPFAECSPLHAAQGARSSARLRSPKSRKAKLNRAYHREAASKTCNTTSLVLSVSPHKNCRALHQISGLCWAFSDSAFECDQALQKPTNCALASPRACSNSAWFALLNSKTSRFSLSSRSSRMPLRLSKSAWISSCVARSIPLIVPLALRIMYRYTNGGNDIVSNRQAGSCSAKRANNPSPPVITESHRRSMAPMYKNVLYSSATQTLPYFLLPGDIKSRSTAGICLAIASGSWDSISLGAMGS
mmetsp:Transcript_55879/g.122423  ORF Transcript_55879/g.122423 Transcript_55879/m.122423 type:complete len:308 (-) Transcript_55879:67-990(-)